MSSFKIKQISYYHPDKIEKKKEEVIKEEPLLASNEKNAIFSIKESSSPSFKKETCGDSLWTEDGKLLVVKIVRADDNQVSYLECSNLDGVQTTVSMTTVAKIKYLNGSVVLNKAHDRVKLKSKSSSSNSKKEDSVSIFSILGFGFAMLGLICFFISIYALFGGLAAFALPTLLMLLFGMMLFGILALVFGLIGIRKSKESDNKTSLALGILGTVFGGILILALILALIILVLFLLTF